MEMERKYGCSTFTAEYRRDIRDDLDVVGGLSATPRDRVHYPACRRARCSMGIELDEKDRRGDRAR
jgi:hypothetical protein